MEDAEADDDAELHELVIADGGDRIDAALAALIDGLSRAQVQRLIEGGRVTANGLVVTKAGQRVRTGDRVTVSVPPPEPLEVVPEPIPLAILYEDADLIAIDKPAGLVVHPAAGHARGTLVNALLYHCKDLSGIGGVLRPGIVHRLDKDTSGVMVATKTDRAHTALAAAFADKTTRASAAERQWREAASEQATITREYLAITAPAPTAPAGTLRTLYGRHPTDRKRFSSKVPSGKPAVTHWRVVEPLPGAALVRFRLETGRTHQIRVHAADHGFPLVGDPVYGRTPNRLAHVAAALGRQALHAALLELDHPVTGERLRLESPLPADFEAALVATRSST